MDRSVNFLYKICSLFDLLFYNFSILRILNSIKLAFFYLLKKDTKYPPYLIEYENKISILNNKKYTLSFSSGTQAFESLIKTLNVNDKKFGIVNIIFPSVFSVLTRYVRSENLKIFNCNKNLKLDLDKDIEQIKKLDFLLVTFAYGYPYNFELINKIFSINDKIILIYDLSHCQGYSVKNVRYNNQIHYFFSTQGSKAISTGEGGIVSTEDYYIYKKMILNSHLNRIEQNLNLSDKESLAIKIGLLPKSRMSPLGAISGLNDLFYLKRRNKILRKKIFILYDEFSNTDKIRFPKIDKFEELTGFHYGVPFLINSGLSDIQKNTLLIQLKKYFKILKYNWLSNNNLEKLIKNDNFKKFENYDFDFLSLDQDFKNDEIFENLYFIDLNYIKILPSKIVQILAKKTIFLIK